MVIRATNPGLSDAQLSKKDVANFRKLLVFKCLEVIVLMGLSGVVYGDDVGIKHRKLWKFNTTQCLSLTTNHPSYSIAVNRVLNLKELKQWQKELGLERKVTYSPATDSTEFYKSECGWSITVYENKTDSLVPWHTYLVPIDTESIFIYSIADDTYKPISK